MMQQGIMQPTMYNQGIMQQGMMQPGMVPNGQPMMNQQPMDPYQQGMMQQPVMDPYQQGMMQQQPVMDPYQQGMMQQQPMMNQSYQQPMDPNYGQTLAQNDPYSAITNVEDTPESSWNFKPDYPEANTVIPEAPAQPVQSEPQAPVEAPVANEVIAPKPAEENIETLEDEVALPREEEKKEEEEPIPQNPKPEGLDALKIENNNQIQTKEEKVDGNALLSNPIFASMDKYQNIEDIGEQENVKANVFAAIGIILGMIVKPGTTMVNNTKKFKKMNKAFSILTWIAVIFLVLCIVVRVVVGSFDRKYSSLTDSYKLVFNPARIFELNNYVEYIIIAASLAVIGVLLVALIYYASSFLNSKGVHFATYLIVSNLGMIPLISGSLILYPIAVIFNGYLGIAVLILSFLTTVIVLLIGMNGVLSFKSLNNQIFYHVLNLSVITLVAVMIFVFMVHNNWIILPQISI